MCAPSSTLRAAKYKVARKFCEVVICMIMMAK